VSREPFEGNDWGRRGDRPASRRRRARRALAELSAAGTKSVAKARSAARKGGRAAPDDPAERGRRRLLPGALIGFGAAIVLVAAVLATDLRVAFSVDELKAPGKAVAAPFEKVHAAQRAMIRKAMNAPFVLGVPRRVLDSIAECESHGNPRSIGGGGLYRGKYQFHRSTWASVGGVGDPARASELEQDRRAAMLLKRSGSSPWPNCG
jgi:Transglycosylase-like domain